MGKWLCLLSLVETRHVFTALPAVITYVPSDDVSSRSIPSLGERLMVPFKYNGRVVDVEWYMDQPFSDVAASLGDLRPVVHGRDIQDTDTPRGLRLDFESVILLLPFGARSPTRDAGGSAVEFVAAVPPSAAPSSSVGVSMEESAVAAAAPPAAGSGDLHIRIRFVDGTTEDAVWQSRMKVASFKALVISVGLLLQLRPG